MSDAAASNSVSCCNMPDSSSQDDHRHHHQSQPAAKLPEYSQQPVDGIDTRAEVIHASSNTQLFIQFNDVFRIC